MAAAGTAIFCYPQFPQPCPQLGQRAIPAISAASAGAPGHNCGQHAACVTIPSTTHEAVSEVCWRAKYRAKHSATFVAVRRQQSQNGQRTAPFSGVSRLSERAL